MADINKRKRDDNDTGEAVGTRIGAAFTGDTIASALDPFGTFGTGTVAGTVTDVVPGRALDNKAGEGTVDDDNHGSKTRD